MRPYKDYTKEELIKQLLIVKEWGLYEQQRWDIIVDIQLELLMRGYYE